MSEKNVFLDTYEREFQTTMKVLKAYPQEKADLQPHPRCRTAKDLAWIFVQEFVDTVLKGEIDFSQSPTKPPATFDEILAAYQKNHREKVEKVKNMAESDWNSTMSFPMSPGGMEQLRRAEVLWMILMDAVHHRGQFSIYLRMADGKVPSIYGPSGDEPWF